MILRKIYKRSKSSLLRLLQNDLSALELKIEDDGSAILREGLKDVHSRKITHFINQEQSFAGLLLEIDE
jgi:hypothetical protein